MVRKSDIFLHYRVRNQFLLAGEANVIEKALAAANAFLLRGRQQVAYRKGPIPP